jgi:hypothetical protein
MLGISRSTLLRTAFAGFLVLGAGGAMGVGPAHADEDDTFEQGLIRQFMRGLGLKDGSENGIQYQERAPLVLPPSRELPPPETTAAAKDANWPVDPDVTRRAKAAKQKTAARKSAGDQLDDSMRPLRPDELARGTKGGPANTAAAKPDIEVGRPLRSEELGGSNLFSGLFSKIGPQKTETTVFRGEPERSSLTAPPAGYRTPSPTRPYGIAAEGDPNKREMDVIKDRAVGQMGNGQ